VVEKVRQLEVSEEQMHYRKTKYTSKGRKLGGGGEQKKAFFNKRVRFSSEGFL